MVKQSGMPDYERILNSDLDREIIARATEHFLHGDEVFTVTAFSESGARWPVFFPNDRGRAAFVAMELDDEELSFENMAIKNQIAAAIAKVVPDSIEIEKRRIEIANTKNKEVVKPPFDPEVLKRLQ